MQDADEAVADATKGLVVEVSGVSVLVVAGACSRAAGCRPSRGCRGGVGMKRGVGIAPDPFLHAALPNRTCGLAPHPALHKPRRAFVAIRLPMARAKGSSTYRVVATEPGLNSTTSPSRGHHAPSQ